LNSLGTPGLKVHTRQGNRTYPDRQACRGQSHEGTPVEVNYDDGSKKWFFCQALARYKLADYGG
jgi:hypothetical protein